MPYRFFHIPLRDSGAAEAELNAFLGNHRVLAVDRRWVDEGADSFWSFCIDYFDSTSGATSGRASKNKGKDYKEVLNADDFAVYAQLRDLRKEISQAEAVPVYTIFTNEQLAQIAQTKPHSKEGLEKIDGVGDARIEKYGPRFLESINRQGKPPDEASGESV